MREEASGNMALVADGCPKILGLLGRFRAPSSRPPVFSIEMLDRADVPQPYHRLLVHRRDMTSTLTEYHREELVLRVLDRDLESESLARRVVLQTVRSRRPVEYGAIRIHLTVLPAETRARVLEGRTPLGGILKAHDVRFANCSGGFFKIRSDQAINDAFHLSRPQWLFGRCNCLTDSSGDTIAEVVEILPPMDGVELKTI